MTSDLDVASYYDLQQAANRYEQALLRISEPGSCDTVESLAEFAAETLIGVQVEN